MQYTLAIGNKLGVVVTGEANAEDGTARPFEFVLECNRLTAEELAQRQADGAATIADFFRTVATGWRNQQIVMDDSGQPAAFSAEALDVLLSVPGMPVRMYLCYLEQVAVRQKNSLKLRA